MVGCVCAADLNDSSAGTSYRSNVLDSSYLSDLPGSSSSLSDDEIQRRLNDYLHPSVTVDDYDSLCNSIRNYSNVRRNRTINMNNSSYVAGDSFNATVDVYGCSGLKRSLTIEANDNTLVTNNYSFDIGLRESIIVVNNLNVLDSNVSFEGVFETVYEMDSERSIAFSSLSFNNCTFTNSSVSIFGNINLLLNNCSFVGDSYVIYAYDNLTVVNCSFTNNSCSYISSEYNLFIGDSLFKGNSFDGSDGVDNPYQYNDSFIRIYQQANVSIVRCNFTSNVNHRGSVIYSMHDYELLNISDNLFEDNDVNYILFYGCSNFGDSWISHNRFLSNSVTNIINLTNTSHYYGSKNRLEIVGNLFENNTGRSGAVLYNRFDVNLTGNVFTNNTSDGLGIILNNAKIVSYNNSFCYNTAAKGAVLYNCRVFKAAKDYYNHNVALKMGGCIYNCGYLDLYTPTMKFNTAVYGSVIFNRRGATASIYKGNIYKNKATRNGTIYNSGNLIMNYTTVNHNRAVYGLIYNIGSLRMNVCAVKNNTCHVGSGLYNVDDNSKASVTVTGSRFTLNKAKVNATLYNSASLYLFNTTLSNMGVNNYLVINYGLFSVDDDSTIINISHKDEDVVLDNSH
ncbi:hypothetical protein [Methanosphaera sp. BMS]|uniref:hypothetical protein n=1 Tax=Methanosphaera sp. BMS TaxID=1789762 RepID=UPI0013A6BA95|nr:hypothetical protein [Methanosphaera sp. BMS]